MSVNLSPWEYQVLALAGVAQSSALVHQLAVSGDAPSDAIVDTLNPLLVLDPESVAAVYPAPSRFSQGLQLLQEMFSNDKVREHSQQVRYMLGMLILRGKLAADNAMQQHLREKLRLIKPLDGDVEAGNEEREQSRHEIIGELASLYQETISTLPYRVQVQGKIEHLRDEHVANCIRALLLAGIRSAFLWYQLGGRRWRLLFYRKRIQETARNIRRSLLTSV